VKDGQQFKLEYVSDNPDGSANYRIDYSDDVGAMLIERGVIAILQDYIAQEQARQKSPAEKKAKREAKKV
jgi:hypothetical protein